MKKTIYVSGRLLFPLRVGSRAVIAKGGDLIYTSRVVEILEETGDIAHFETMNSIYRVAFAPVPSGAALCDPLKLCA